MCLWPRSGCFSSGRYLSGTKVVAKLNIYILMGLLRRARAMSRFLEQRRQDAPMSATRFRRLPFEGAAAAGWAAAEDRTGSPKEYHSTTSCHNVCKTWEMLFEASCQANLVDFY